MLALCQYWAQHTADFCIPGFQRLAFEISLFQSHCAEISIFLATMVKSFKQIYSFKGPSSKLNFLFGQILAFNIIYLQQWNLSVPVTCPSSDFSNKKTLPLQIPSLQGLTDWPD
jgi:hypothetical protein